MSELGTSILAFELAYCHLRIVIESSGNTGRRHRPQLCPPNYNLIFIFSGFRPALSLAEVHYSESPCRVLCKMTNVVNFRCMVATDQISVHLKVVAPSSNCHVMLFIITIETEREEGWAPSRVPKYRTVPLSITGNDEHFKWTSDCFT